jgi:phosphatidylserine decarboxylase
VGRASYTQQLLDRATTYVEQPLAARRYAEGMAEVSALYAEITGEPISSCRQCQYSNYLAVVTAYIREATRFLHPETMADSNYTFAPQFANEQIADGRYSKVVTAETLTDKDAEALIKLGYGHVIVKKGAAAAGEPAGDDKAGTSEADTKAKADLKTEKEAHKATKSELTATKKELVATATKLAEAEKTVAELQAKLLPAPTDVVTGDEAQ